MVFKIERTASPKNDLSLKVNKILNRELHFSTSKFNAKNKEMFYFELGLFLEAGVSLKEALSLIAQAVKQSEARKCILAIREDLVAGLSLSKAMRVHVEFSDYECFTIKAGEEAGALQQVCCALGAYFERKNTQRKQLLSALSYPMVVLATAFLVVGFMMHFVVPMFATVFRQNNIELPLITRWIILFSRAIQTYFWQGLAIVFLLIIFCKWLLTIEKVQKYSSLFLVSIPVIGKLLKTVYLGQFTQAMSLLLSAKVPLLSGLQLTEKMIAFYPLQQVLSQSSMDLCAGMSLSKSLSKSPLVDSKMISLLKVAEETHQNQYIFERLSSWYQQEIKQRSKILTTILEPLLILFLGCIVALVLIAMYLPMFQLSTVLG